MNLDDIERVKRLLACAHQFRANVCRHGTEFKELRKKLLRSLQTLNSSNVSIHVIKIGLDKKNKIYLILSDQQ